MDHPHRAAIPPVPEGVSLPLWSVMIPTYHCARYLQETLAQVLIQDAGPEHMQIEVVDDHSTADDPAAVVADAGHGRVGFYRQVTNVGHVKNFETCLTRSRGRLIHLLHGDDYVEDGFYRTMQRAFEERPDIGAAFCRPIFIDGEGRQLSIAPVEQMGRGILRNGLERLAEEQRVMTPAIVVRRVVYEQLGGFDRRLKCSEDWEMWVRIAARYPIWYEDAPLAAYRMHTASNTGRHLRTAEDLKYTRLAITIFTTYLPRTLARKVSRKARETYAIAALNTAYAMFTDGDRTAMTAQLREALACSPSPVVFRQLAGLLMRGVTRRIRRK